MKIMRIRDDVIRLGRAATCVTSCAKVNHGTVRPSEALSSRFDARSWQMLIIFQNPAKNHGLQASVLVKMLRLKQHPW
jgi:hypothetical protein